MHWRGRARVHPGRQPSGIARGRGRLPHHGRRGKNNRIPISDWNEDSHRAGGGLPLLGPRIAARGRRRAFRIRFRGRRLPLSPWDARHEHRRCDGDEDSGRHLDGPQFHAATKRRDVHRNRSAEVALRRLPQVSGRKAGWRPSRSDPVTGDRAQSFSEFRRELLATRSQGSPFVSAAESPRLAFSFSGTRAADGRSFSKSERARGGRPGDAVHVDDQDPRSGVSRRGEDDAAQHRAGGPAHRRRTGGAVADRRWIRRRGPQAFPMAASGAIDGDPRDRADRERDSPMEDLALRI